MKKTFILLILLISSCSTLNFLRSRSPNSIEANNDYHSSFISFPNDHQYPYIPLREDLGEELIKNEKEKVLTAAKAIETTIKSRAKKGIRGRGDHSTSQGCYSAELRILPDIPKELSHGISSLKNQGQTFQTVIRYSNSEPTNVKDIHSASLGMAVKVYLDQSYASSDFLLGQWQPQILEQDFLSGTSKSFAFKDISDYSTVFSQRANPTARNTIAFAVKNPGVLINRGLAPRLRVKKSQAPLIPEKRFWGSLPYAWGDQVIKYSFKPCHYVNRENLEFDHKEKRYQRSVLKQFLEKQELCYEMVAQLRPSLKIQNVYDQKIIDKYFPIENATLFWPDEQNKRLYKKHGSPRYLSIYSSFQNIARLKVSRQSKPLPKEQCEKIVFNPWNGLKEHQPLGSLSRGRLSVYIKSKETRYNLYKKGAESEE